MASSASLLRCSRSKSVKARVFTLSVLLFHVLICGEANPKVLPAFDLVLKPQSFAPAQLVVEVACIHFPLGCLYFLLVAGGRISIFRLLLLGGCWCLFTDYCLTVGLQVYFKGCWAHRVLHVSLFSLAVVWEFDGAR